MKLSSNESLFPSAYKEAQETNVLCKHARDSIVDERLQCSAVDYHKIKLPNLSFKQRKKNEADANNRNAQNPFVSAIDNNSGEFSESSIERLPSAKGCVKISRNGKIHKSRSMLTKNDDSVGQEEEEVGKQPMGMRKIKIIQNSKNSKGSKIKNSHMVILKSIKQKLNLQGMLKNKD